MTGFIGHFNRIHKDFRGKFYTKKKVKRMYGEKYFWTM